MDKQTILLEAKAAAPQRPSLDEHREAILLLRRKEYSWRQIAQFLTDRGVPTDHTSVYRLVHSTTKPKPATVKTTTTSLPKAEEYERALETIEISPKQRLMLRAHYHAVNRSITYTDLAKAAGYEGNDPANSQYGGLGRKIGEVIGYDFVELGNKSRELFYSSAIGCGNPYTPGPVQLLMHHELARAIANLGWFDSDALHRRGAELAKRIADEDLGNLEHFLGNQGPSDEVTLDLDFITTLANAIKLDDSVLPKFADNNGIGAFLNGLAETIDAR